ncbi:hypothetical protein [Thalassomonas haliotis]|uniref:Lycopene cyclase domain-containing protein n=1 Tax=Thalassomonas haliotis TaxID=485448 RepID=A0ABY7VEE5_9GAMM|nr:hypothetical protein [Thalassomonas haliotis]WDE12094.1 hypothetical protein H3N35_00980 [Thalassomonas haliotis]
MKYKLASAVLALFSLLGIGVIAFSGVEDKAFVDIFSYLVVFVLIPGYGAYGVWYKRRKAMLVTLMVFASLSIREVGLDSWFPYFPPLSLGIPFGDFSDGQGYLADFFAIAMAMSLAILLWPLVVPEKR